MINTSNRNRSETNVGTLSSKATFLMIGGGIGAGLALLFAPKPGRELRGDIAELSRRGYDSALSTASDLKEQSKDAKHIVREKAGAVYESASAQLGKGEDAVREASDNTTRAVKDGIDRVENEADRISSKTGTGRRASGIL
jgi:gas vesicle protein